MIAVLADLPGRVDVAHIEQLWLFPPRRLGNRESGVVVLALRPTEEFASARRVLFTLRYEIEDGRGSRRTETFEEQGSAPSERIPHVMAGVIRRLGESEVASLHAIHGDAAQWDALLAKLRADALDRACGE